MSVCYVSQIQCFPPKPLIVRNRASHFPTHIPPKGGVYVREKMWRRFLFQPGKHRSVRQSGVGMVKKEKCKSPRHVRRQECGQRGWYIYMAKPANPRIPPPLFRVSLLHYWVSITWIQYPASGVRFRCSRPLPAYDLRGKSGWSSGQSERNAPDRCDKEC